MTQQRMKELALIDKEMSKKALTASKLAKLASITTTAICAGIVTNELVTDSPNKGVAAAAGAIFIVEGALFFMDRAKTCTALESVNDYADRLLKMSNQQSK